MKVFYHADMDGICSAAIVYLWAKEKGFDIKKEDFFQKEYGPDDKLDKTIFAAFREKVVVVDFCFTLEEMDWLNNNHELIWIDHHKSSIEKMESILPIEGINDISEAGCYWTWKYFFPELDIPEAVYLLGDYDIWRFEDERSLPFQYGIKSFGDINPFSNWNALFDLNSYQSSSLTARDIETIVTSGQTILKYLKQNNAEYVKQYAFDAIFESYNVIAVNMGRASSKVFDEVYDPEKHDMMLAYVHLPEGGWRISLYSTKDNIDCSDIAKHRGGGGHKGAAGFVSSDSLFPSLTLKRKE